MTYHLFKAKPWIGDLSNTCTERISDIKPISNFPAIIISPFFLSVFNSLKIIFFYNHVVKKNTLHDENILLKPKTLILYYQHFEFSENNKSIDNPTFQTNNRIRENNHE